MKAWIAPRSREVRDSALDHTKTKGIAMTTIMNEARHAESGSVIARETLDSLRTVLEVQRQTLARRATELVDDIKDLQITTASRGQSETDHAGNDVELGMTLALEANTLAALEDIAFARARMDDGSYGICADCSIPIGVERLMAVPGTRYCVMCQRRRERELDDEGRGA
jgi:DnaK suppressor protein